MTQAPGDTGTTSRPPRMRAGTTDRQTAVDRLTTNFADGRLDAAEFDQRVTAAYSSTYLDELTGLFVDLPSSPPDRSPWAADRRGYGPPGPPGGGRTDWSSRGRHVRRPGPPPPVRLALFVLMMMLIIGSISAVGHGFFPFPLLWLAIVLLMLSRLRHRRWSGHR